MDCQAPILPILGKPITHVGLVSGDDASLVPSLALSIASCQAVVGCWVHPRLAHPPAFRIDGRSLPEGGSISWFTQGWELRPPSAIKLSAQVVPFEPALPLIPRQTPVSRERVAPIHRRPGCVVSDEREAARDGSSAGRYLCLQAASRGG